MSSRAGGRSQRQPVAKRREARLIFVAILLRPGRRHVRKPVSGSRNSVRPAIGEGLLDRVDDLDEMRAAPAAAIGDEARSISAIGSRKSPIEHHIGKRRSWPGRRQRGAAVIRASDSASRSAALRERIGWSRRAGRRARRPATRSSASASSQQHRAVALAEAGASRERKTIEAERSAHSQTRVRRLPFRLADIEMIVAAPSAASRSPAAASPGDEGTELPERLAAAAARAGRASRQGWCVATRRASIRRSGSAGGDAPWPRSRAPRRRRTRSLAIGVIG